VHGYVQAKKFSKMWLYEILDRVALRSFDRIALVSGAMKEIPAIRKLSSKTCVIFNGLPVEYEHAELEGGAEALRSKFDMLGLAVGRLSPEKGFDVLLSSLVTLFKKVPRLKGGFGVIIYGEGGQRSELEGLIKENALSENVILAGYADDAGSLMFNFDVLIMPSLTEGLPITLLEAARAKLPLVASNVGAIPEVLGGGYKYLVEPGKADTLAAVLESFLFNKGELSLQADVDNVAKTFRSRFSSEVMANAYLNVYRLNVRSGDAA
jgi:glycosyltransferase involved in cell wall biosynthesis